jgi:TolB-like protein
VIKIMPGLKQRLKDMGLHVIDEDLLSDFLCDRRIRSASYISKKIAREVGKELNAKTILTGSVVSFSSEGNPKVGILSRLIDSSTGVILWADYVSVSGDDYSIVFGMGTIRKVEELVPKMLDKLFASFSMGISPMNKESVYRIAVMPFKNNSGSPNAGMIATHMFLVELLKDPAFEPVEYGEIRKLCVELKIRNKGELEFKNIKAISEALGTYMILLGSVDDYVYGTKSSAVPNVGISVRLLDARENRILWYNKLQLSGEEDIIAFDWGNVRQVDKLAYKAVSELVRELRKLEWH